MIRYLLVTSFLVAIALSSSLSLAADGCSPTYMPGCGGCPCESCVCAMDMFCCYSSWDSICASECVDYCGGCTTCGNGTCEPAEEEDCGSCPEDCGCPPDQVCDGATCCTPQCEGKECGDNGCNGLCGTCEGGTCFDGQCCFPDCVGKECGADGCGGSCGDCPPYDKCEDGQCVVCEPDCTDKNCGTDGCGGSCGECEFGQFCPATGVCEDLPRCEPVGILSCEATVVDSTANGKNLFQAYGCAGGLHKGAELAYEFVADQDDTVTLTLEEIDGAADLSIFLLADPCIEDNCQAHHTKKLSSPVAAGESLFVLVDTGSLAPTSFKMSIACKSQCASQCAGKNCGPDGCGGTCGECEDGMVCAMGNCKEYGGFGWPCLGDFECDSGLCGQGPDTTVCTTACDSDSDCPPDWSCVNDGGTKVCLSDCLPDCTDNECGDNGCGYLCGQCAKGYMCEDNLCVEAPCEPSCIGKECGSDGCGGSCGDCDDGFECKGTQCHEIPCEVDCTGKVCGPSNCPGKGCGLCDEGLECIDGQCYQPPCQPQCDGLECGPDGCEGTCGECTEGHECQAGLCLVVSGPEVEPDTINQPADGGPLDSLEADGKIDAIAPDGETSGGQSSCSTSGPGQGMEIWLLLLVGIWILGRVRNQRAHQS